VTRGKQHECPQQEQFILGEDLELKEGLSMDVSMGKNSKGSPYLVSKL